MPLANGAHHVALVTGDLDALIDFHRAAFDAEVEVDMTEHGLRHALIHLGGGFRLHPFEMPDNPSAAASAATFERGHLDHLAIAVEDEESFQKVRARLVELGATDGTLTDFGMVRSVWFEDPDGMGCEIAISSDGAPNPIDVAPREAFATA